MSGSGPVIINNKKSVIAAVVVIVALQCLMLFYWQSQRNNFYIDELYCFGYASSFVEGDKAYITDRSDWQYDMWMDAGELQELLRVDSNECLEKLPLTEQISMLAKKRAYMGMLNYIMYDIGTYESFYRYAWSALMLNIGFFLIAELLMAYCIRELTDSYELMVLGIIMFGFCSVITAMCEYIRFYMLTIMLMLIVISCHLAIWKDQKRVTRGLIFEMIAFVSAYYALKHSELMLVTCGAFFCFFFIGLLLRRRFRQAVLYGAPLLCGAYRYVYLKTDLIQIVLHPADFSGPGHGVESATRHLLSWTPQAGWECAKAIYRVFADRWFGSSFIMAAFIAVLLCGSVFRLSGCREPEKRDRSGGYGGFVVIIIMTAFVSLLFNDLTNLFTDRYNSFVVVLLMIVLWYAAAYVRECVDRKQFMILITVLTVASAALCQQPDKLPFLYINEKAVRTAVAECGDVDSILFNRGDRHSAYDCVANISPETGIYAVSSDSVPDLNDPGSAPEVFLAWCVNTGGTEQLMQALDNTDYQARKLGSTWQNEVFLCSKR